ncbi:DUF397 domain-containing protein [Streptomyces sp. TRM 70361]|uniref:DUF397 domain-containing protein n=1 Tax=Streptomyces sp. TRM 70361 TaxID=3116553 RepID=UPI002E7B2BD3|nr:DUF397 domain-containing protein [Streptomyces sp. TRM 70361]MEE1941005.1 DUF397 domain-containing protein [Streptomyces sp. TRM 70361]
MSATDEQGWFKSSYSGSEGDNCVEVAVRLQAVLVRDSKDIRRQPLSVSPAAWADFLDHTARGPWGAGTGPRTPRAAASSP